MESQPDAFAKGGVKVDADWKVNPEAPCFRRYRIEVNIAPGNVLSSMLLQAWIACAGIAPSLGYGQGRSPVSAVVLGNLRRGLLPYGDSPVLSDPVDAN